LPKDKRWLPGDNHLLMQKWWDFKHGTHGISDTPNLDQWVDSRMYKHVFADILNLFFYVEAIISFLFLVVLSFG
jgi:hypothetical protein